MKGLIYLFLSLFLSVSAFSQSISGIFKTDFNELTIIQSGVNVTGTYKHNGGRIEGKISGNTITGWWYQSNGKGKFVFVFNADFSSFTGKWAYNESTPNSVWNGTRILPTVPTSIPNNESQSFSGIFKTDFNELSIIQSGVAVTGTYKHNDGRIEGKISGNTITGWWYQSNGKGKFIFVFNSDFSSFTGKWGYNESAPNSVWNGKRVITKVKDDIGIKADDDDSKIVEKKSDSDTKKKTENTNEKESGTDLRKEKIDDTKSEKVEKDVVEVEDSENELTKNNNWNEVEKKYIQEALEDLNVAISDRNLSDNLRAVLIKRSSKTLKEYGYPYSFPSSEIPLVTNKKKEFDQRSESIWEILNLSNELNKMMLSKQLSLINGLQIEVVGDQISLLIPGKGVVDLTLDLVGTVFGLNFVEGFNRGKVNDANDLKNKFRDLAVTKALSAELNSLYKLEREKIFKDQEKLENLRKLEKSLREIYDDANNSAFTFEQFKDGTNQNVNPPAKIENSSENKGTKWILVENRIFDGKKYIDITNKNGVYKESSVVTLGNYQFKWSYLGNTDKWYNPPKKNGEGAAIVCTTSTPPKIINFGEEVSVNFSMYFSENTLSYFSSSATFSASFDKWDVDINARTGSINRLKNNNNVYSFIIDTHKNVFRVSDTLSTKMQSCVKGEKVSLFLSFYTGKPLGVAYVYSCQ